jgi:hypothetical protein
MCMCVYVHVSTCIHMYLRAHTHGWGSASSISWEISAGSAVAGVDYGVPTKGTLTLEKGEAVKNLSVPILINPQYSATPRTFTVQLSAPSGGSPYEFSVHRALGSAVVSVAESRAVATFGFLSGNISVWNDADVVKLPIVIRDDKDAILDTTLRYVCKMIACTCVCVNNAYISLLHHTCICILVCVCICLTCTRVYSHVCGLCECVCVCMRV